MSKKGCGVCGKEVGMGSGVVLHYGRGGRTHKHCLPEGKEVRLADGSVFRRGKEANSDAAMGILREATA